MKTFSLSNTIFCLEVLHATKINKNVTRIDGLQAVKVSIQRITNKL